MTYKVKQEVPADGIILDQMGCDVCGRVWGKGHQKIGSCYCQGATYGGKTAESGDMVVKALLKMFFFTYRTVFYITELKLTHYLLLQLLTYI